MSARFASVLVANRGEIACRIIRAARAEGLRAIAVFSGADADALHVRLADAAVRIGPAAAAQSYLSIDALIAAAKAGAEAVHPGYGFLAESADLADHCAAAGLVFVGPPPAAMRAMADKSAAKARMIAAGVPCAPGYHGEDQSAARFAEEARRLGYPLMVKAIAGGGGRGMRIVREPEALGLRCVRRARRRTPRSATDVYSRASAARPRHIEVQVFGDVHGTVVPFVERECSFSAVTRKSSKRRRRPRSRRRCGRPWARRPHQAARRRSATSAPAPSSFCSPTTAASIFSR